MEFNTNLPRIVHLDINSCFATIEQQANPKLRDKAVVVAAYTTSSGCILASSITAKKMGIKTGMRVGDGRLICPNLIVLEPDPEKYRFVHKKLKKLLEKYSPLVTSKSIDEFVFEIVKGSPVVVSRQIKERIKKEIGEYITVSIGISTNRYLAKVASNLQKPDGLSVINKSNYHKVFSNLKLTDLTGIKINNSNRLRSVGIKTVNDFYSYPLYKLKIAFGGIGGLYWHLRLHGYEIDDFKSTRKVVGNSYAPPPNHANKVGEIMIKLTEKTGLRLRYANLKALGVHLYIQDRNGTSWHMGRTLKRYVSNSCDIYREMNNLLRLSPIKNNIRNIAISTFKLKQNSELQLEIFDNEVGFFNVLKKEELTKSLDLINTKYGDYTIYPARMVNTKDMVKDRIAFGQ
ncbi:MAG: hypothetical protein QY322_00555 [bacterium]|nr:MAG: hypothetical protein QY322_00555 [bacterium]